MYSSNGLLAIELTAVAVLILSCETQQVGLAYQQIEVISNY